MKKNTRISPIVDIRNRLQTKKSPKYFYSEDSVSKTATTYSPTNQQYHRRDEA